MERDPDKKCAVMEKYRESIYGKLLPRLIQLHLERQADPRYTNVAPNEVVFDVTELGVGLGDISSWLRALRDDGILESVTITGAGEGWVFFTPEGLRRVEAYKAGQEKP